MQKSPFYLLFSPDTKNEFSGNIKAPSLRLLRTPVAFSPSSSTRGDGALAVVAVPSFQHSISSAQRRRGAVATFAPRTSSLFAIAAHPWRRRPRRRGSSKLPTRHITRTATARRRRYVCSAHQWPFRHHHPPVATAPSPSWQFQASNIAYHPHSDGEAPSLRLLRTPMAFSPSPHTRGLFAITAHPWRRRPRRRGRSQLPT